MGKYRSVKFLRFLTNCQVDDRINRIEAAMRALTANMKAMQDIDSQRRAAMFRQHAGTGPDVVVVPASLTSSPSLPGGAHREHWLGPISDQGMALQDINSSWSQPDLSIPMEALSAYGVPAHHQAGVGAYY